MRSAPAREHASASGAYAPPNSPAHRACSRPVIFHIGTLCYELPWTYRIKPKQPPRLLREPPLPHIRQTPVAPRTSGYGPPSLPKLARPRPSSARGHTRKRLFPSSSRHRRRSPSCPLPVSYTHLTLPTKRIV